MSDAETPPLTGDAAAAAADTNLGMVLLGPSWQEQDGLLRDLWLQNKTPQEISAVLGRSVAAIMTRAARLGLPRRAAPGRKPGSGRRLPEQGGPGEQTRVSTPRTVARTPRIDSDDPPVSQVSARICLLCLRSFQSQGRHNRICASCKGSSEYHAAVSLSDIHFPV